MDMRDVVLRAVGMIVLSCIVLMPRPGEGQPVLRVLDIAALTCADLLSLHEERRDRALIYFNGYLNGMRQGTTWDEGIDGERIEHVMAECQANPGGPLLDAFTRAWAR